MPMDYQQAVEWAAYNWSDEPSRYVAAKMISRIFDKDINDVWSDMTHVSY